MRSIKNKSVRTPKGDFPPKAAKDSPAHRPETSKKAGWSWSMVMRSTKTKNRRFTAGCS